VDSVGTPEKEGVEVVVGHTAEGTGKEEQNIDHIRTEEGREVVGVEGTVSRSSDHRSLNCLNLSALILFRCFCLECLCASVCMCAKEQRKRICACVCFCVGVLYGCVHIQSLISILQLLHRAKCPQCHIHDNTAHS